MKIYATDCFVQRYGGGTGIFIYSTAVYFTSYRYIFDWTRRVGIVFTQLPNIPLFFVLIHVHIRHIISYLHRYTKTVVYWLPVSVFRETTTKYLPTPVGCSCSCSCVGVVMHTRAAAQTVEVLLYGSYFTELKFLFKALHSSLLARRDTHSVTWSSWQV